MKGVIFQIVEDVIVALQGEALWDTLLEASGLDGVYTAHGLYDDNELFRIVAAGSTTLNVPPRSLLRLLGKLAIPTMNARWPKYFSTNNSTLELLGHLDSVIHPEVRALYPGAVCPHFNAEVIASNRLRLSYQSPRKLCDLAHGFIDGVAAYYGEDISIDHLTCMHDGALECQLAVSTERQ